MRRRLANPRCLATPVWVCAFIFLSVLAPAYAQSVPDPLEEPIFGCGKAEAMARGHWAATTDSASPSYRETMPDTDVLHYNLAIEISNLNTAGNSCTITGSNVMTIQSKSAALTEFTFRLRNQFDITAALVNGTTPIAVTSTSTTTRVATLDRAYGMDEVFTLTIVYSGPTFSDGFGSIAVTSQSGTPVVATLSEAYYAHTWWPAKDGDVGLPGDNSDKSTVEFSITAPNNFVVPSNGLLLSVDTLSDNRLRYNWKTDYPITPYLVSFAATNYNTWTQFYNHPGGSMPVQFYLYPSNDTPTNRTNWEKVINMLAIFRPLYGEYPFINEKYGLYNFPFGGGMEHQTITGQSGYSESLSSHELSHQWWGDMITCKTWSDIWLNEGFATYGEVLWEENKTGSPSSTAYLNAISARKPSFSFFSGSVYIPAGETNMSRIFDGNLSYRKGAWVLHQLRHVVGDATFFNILANYRAAYLYKAATTDDFAAVASSTSGQDLTWFFDQWVYQVGAPAYQYGWDTAVVNGQDYLLARVRQTQGGTYPQVFTMPLDLVVTIAGSPQTITLWNDQRAQWFATPVSGPVTAVQFDPRQWVLRTASQSTTYIGGDLDEDLDVDNDDYTDLGTCFTGSGGQLVSGCEPADFDGDGDIDCSDGLGFQQAWTAPGDPPQLPQCAVAAAIPTVSQWGLMVMTWLMLAAGTVVLRRRENGAVGRDSVPSSPVP